MYLKKWQIWKSESKISFWDNVSNSFFVGGIFKSSTLIEIIDKSQDSEMALPTNLTVFNRKMINLENEIGVLKSTTLHQKTVSTLNANVKFFTVGLIKTRENHYSNWFGDLGVNYNLDFKIDTDTVKTKIIY